MNAPSSSLGHFARRIEADWSELRGEPTVLSPRDWELIRQWHEDGVPFELIAESMAEVRHKLRRGRIRVPRSLGYLRESVATACAAIREGRVRESGVATQDAAPAGVATPAEPTWTDYVHAAAKDDALARLLVKLLARRERGAAAAELDAELDAALPDLVPSALRQEVDGELDRELAGYRERMSAARLESTRSLARVRRLRTRLRLPRLAAPGRS